MFNYQLLPLLLVKKKKKKSRLAYFRQMDDAYLDVCYFEAGLPLLERTLSLKQRACLR